jgi:carboxyl-terminal processing protease
MLRSLYFTAWVLSISTSNAFVVNRPAHGTTTGLPHVTTAPVVTSLASASQRSFDTKLDPLKRLSNFASKLSVSLALALAVATASPATALSYDSFTEEQKVVAEAWRLVDNSFLDRTFNGQDWFKLRQEYIKQTKYESREEAHEAIDRMVSTLGDKYTRYLSPAKYQSIFDTATGTLAGVGIEIATDSNGLVMASDIEDKSPAKAAGILSGDLFVEVDGIVFDAKSTPDDVAVNLRGPIGSKVGVVMERNGKKLDFIVTRQPITITAVRSHLSTVPGIGKVGVIRIKSFSGTTASTVASQFKDLKKQGAQSFVIDVRGNPGGLLPGGVETASLFLDADKPVVYVVNKKGVVDAQSTFTAGADLESPLVIL